jgi:putative membrane protein
MVTLTDTDREALTHCVTEAEKHTSAEIVLSVAETCDDYRVHTLPYAALAGFLVFGALALVMPDVHVRMAFLATGAGVFLAGLALQWRPLRLLTVPRAVKEDAAARLAHLEYAALVAGRTSAANGILIFIALAERHAEILPEPGLAAAVPQTTWQKIMDALIADLAAGRVRQGIEAAIAACADACEAAFPPRADDRDELSNAPRIARQP